VTADSFQWKVGQTYKVEAAGGISRLGLSRTEYWAVQYGIAYEVFETTLPKLVNKMIEYGTIQYGIAYEVFETILPEFRTKVTEYNSRVYADIKTEQLFGKKP
jgi:hypothetical protein